MNENVGGFPPKSCMGRPSKITNEIKSIIEDYTIMNPAHSDSDLQNFLSVQNNLNIGRSTINRAKKSLNFRWKPPKIRQLLSERQIGNRIQFGRFIKENNIQSHKILFSDESRISIQNDSQYIWRRIGDDSESVFMDKVKFPVSIMIWGCIGYNYKSNIIQIEGSLDSEKYIQMLDDHQIFEEIDKFKGKGNYWFQQDGATCHTSQKTINEISKKCSVLPNWPANSPDLSPIEILWGILKIYIKIYKPRTKRDLLYWIRKAWDMIPYSTINKLVLSFENRIDHMLNKNGSSIQDDLRNHRIKEVDGFEDLEEYPWRQDEDDLLIEKVQVLGQRWDTIHHFFIKRSPKMIEIRYKTLKNLKKFHSIYSIFPQ